MEYIPIPFDYLRYDETVMLHFMLNHIRITVGTKITRITLGTETIRITV